MRERTNLLKEYFDSKKEEDRLIDGSFREQLENDFYNYTSIDRGESDVLRFVDEMCLESLDPDTFEKWEEVKNVLKQNRILLKKYSYV